MLQVKVNGLNEMLVVLDQLSDVEKDKAVKSGLRTAGNVFRREGLNQIRSKLSGTTKRSYGRQPGNLLSSIRVRVKRSKPGVLTGFDEKGHHAHLADLGTKERFFKTGIRGQRRKSSGRMPATHFWTTTKQSKEIKASEALFTGLERAVNRIIDRRK
ncbi:MAG: hypothetical protein LBV72_10060 [Tannerella sp.]|jgi:hypothetical protein|nr:hypothetical protein [Tannerella sp.]